MIPEDDRPLHAEPASSDAPRASLGPLQYGLASLLVIVTVCAVAFSFWNSLGPGPVAFIIGFSAMTMLILRMMAHKPSGSLVVMDVASDAGAHACRNLLRRQGIAAEVVNEQHAQVLQHTTRSPQIIVPADQAGRARQLLEELEQTRHATQSRRD